MDLPQFDYSSKTIQQHVIEREIVTEIRPGQLYDGISELKYDFVLADNEFMLPDETYLYVKAQCEVNTAANAADEDKFKKVSHVNYLLNSMWSQTQIEINGEPITVPSTTNAYKAILEVKLAYSKEARDAHLSAARLFKDADDLVLEKEIKGNQFEMEGRLHFDVTHQPVALPGGRRYCVTLTRQSDSFIFCTSDTTLTPRLKIIEAILFVKRAILTPAAVKRIYSKKMLRIPLTKSYVRGIPIEKDALDVPLEDVCRGRLPRRIFLALVENRAFNGDLRTDPFIFKQQKLNHCVAFVDGVPYPTQAFRPGENGMVMKEYIGFIKALKQNNTDSYACLNFNDYKKDNFILGITLAPDCYDEGQSSVINSPKHGTLRIQLGFNGGAPEKLTALIYLEFDSELCFDGDRTISDLSTIDQK